MFLNLKCKSDRFSLAFLALFAILVMNCSSTKTEVASTDKSAKVVEKIKEPPKDTAKVAESPKNSVKPVSAGEKKEPIKADKVTKDTVMSDMSEIKVARAVICTAIVDREPQGSAETFAKGLQKLSCFSHIEGVKDTLKIQHKWYYKEQLAGTVPLTVRSMSWRTYSSKKIEEKMTGDWKVEIVNAENGGVLKTLSFSVE